MPGLLKKLKFPIKGRVLRLVRRLRAAAFFAPGFWLVLGGGAIAAETVPVITGPAVPGIDPIWFFLGFGVSVFAIGIGIAFTLVLRRQGTAVRAPLLEGTDNFREMAEFAADWVWEMDGDLRFSYLSPRFFEKFEITPDMILGKTRAEYTEHKDTNISGKDWKKHLKILEDHLPFRDFRYSIKDKYGRTRYLRVSGQPVFSADGEFTGYQGVGTDLTPEFEATAQAARADATLLDAIESISTGFSLWDSDDKLVLCNSKWREAHPEMARLAEPGILFEDYFTGVAKIAVYAASMGDLKTQVKERMEFHRNTPSHHEQRFADGRWVNIHEYGTHDGGTVILWTDITERKQAEEALEESEERFRNLIEGSVQGVLIHARHEPLFVNQAYAEIFGYDSPEEMIAQGDALAHVAPHEQERMKGYSEGRIRGESVPENYEFEGVRKDGSSIWVENRARAVTWEDRIAVQRTIVDITERKRAEEALRQSEENYRNLVDGSVQGVFIHHDFKPLFVNEVLVKMFGYSSAEEIMALDSIDLLYAPEERARLRDMYKARFSGDPVPEYYEFKGLKKDGTIIWLQRTSRTVTYEGKPAVQGAMMDITDSKNIEESLRRAKEMAETANRAKSEFLANMSHELRTPLNSVIGFSEVIKDQILGPEKGAQYRNYANYIYSSGQHLLGLISDILDVSKIEVGEMDVSDDNIEIGPVIDTCARMIQERADKAGVILTVKNTQACPMLLCDERRLKQILLNLLSNAVKFTPPQGKVNIGAKPFDGGVQFWVEDTGIGIAEDDIPLVLKPFAQVASSQTRSHEGTGLGLALVQSLCDLQGAKLEIKSKTGEGTMVAVNFPRERVLDASKRETEKA